MKIKLGTSTEKIKYHDHFHYTIAHHEASDVVYGFQRKTWKEIDKPFSWEITRPKMGTETFSRTCLYCGKTLRIVGVCSLDDLVSNRKKYKKIGRISAIVFASMLITAIATSYSIFNSTAQSNWVGPMMCFSFFGSMISAIPLLISFADLGESKSPGYCGGAATGELQASRNAILRQSDAHYIKSKESY